MLWVGRDFMKDKKKIVSITGKILERKWIAEDVLYTFDLICCKFWIPLNFTLYYELIFLHLDAGFLPLLLNGLVSVILSFNSYCLSTTSTLSKIKSWKSVDVMLHIPINGVTIIIFCGWLWRCTVIRMVKVLDFEISVSASGFHGVCVIIVSDSIFVTSHSVPVWCVSCICIREYQQI